jgi:hypothetical protein
MKDGQTDRTAQLANAMRQVRRGRQGARPDKSLIEGWAAPHRDANGVCSQCAVAWPCRSIITGIESERRPASGYDFASLPSQYSRVRADLVLDGSVVDCGRRVWNLRTDTVQIAYKASSPVPQPRTAANCTDPERAD